MQRNASGVVCSLLHAVHFDSMCRHPQCLPEKERYSSGRIQSLMTLLGLKDSTTVRGSLRCICGKCPCTHAFNVIMFDRSTCLVDRR